MTREISRQAFVRGALGGVVAADDTAFPWRRQAAGIQWYTEPPSQAAIETADKWLAGAHAAVHAHSVGGYVNYVEPDTPAARYFAGNLERLTAIRRKYDPGGLMNSGM